MCVHVCVYVCARVCVTASSLHIQNFFLAESPDKNLSDISLYFCIKLTGGARERERETEMENMRAFAA